MDRQEIACFFDLQETEFDFLEGTLNKYDIGRYAIAFEANPRPHFHLFFEGTNQIYNNFSKVIIEKYKLRRQGRGGAIKYGKVKNLRDIERMLIYTLKDGNFRSTYDNEILKVLFAQSFKKEDKQKLIEDMVTTICEKHESQLDECKFTFPSVDPNDFRRWIIEFCILKEIPLSRPKIDRYLNYFVQFNPILCIEYKEAYFESLNPMWTSNNKWFK